MQEEILELLNSCIDCDEGFSIDPTQAKWIKDLIESAVNVKAALDKNGGVK
jgi:hypothetical protein